MHASLARQVEVQAANGLLVRVVPTRCFFQQFDKDAQGANGHLLSATRFPKTKKSKIKIKKSKNQKKGSWLWKRNALDSCLLS